MENFLKCYNNLDDNTSDQENKQLNVSSEKYKTSIKKTAFLLEDKAVEACRIALRYQRAMVKIVSIDGLGIIIIYLIFRTKILCRMDIFVHGFFMLYIINIISSTDCNCATFDPGETPNNTSGKYNHEF